MKALLFVFCQVREEEARDYAASVEAIFAETSALTSKNVYWLFEEICKCDRSNFK